MLIRAEWKKFLDADEPFGTGWRTVFYRFLKSLRDSLKEAVPRSMERSKAPSAVAPLKAVPLQKKIIHDYPTTT
jgi:hypothetical protein